MPIRPPALDDRRYDDRYNRYDPRYGDRYDRRYDDRRYRDEPIPDHVLRDMLFAATRAPSGSNRQPFRFVVLTDSPRAKKAKALIGETARQFWAQKRANDQYDKGSGADPDSPKSRMARTMARV